MGSPQKRRELGFVTAPETTFESETFGSCLGSSPTMKRVTEGMTGWEQPGKGVGCEVADGGGKETNRLRKFPHQKRSACESRAAPHDKERSPAGVGASQLAIGPPNAVPSE